MSLRDDQLLRFQRNILLAEVGREGQLALSRARVLIVGAGGLAAPVAMYLAAAGVGTLGLVDHDRVELSNLQRQILYGEGQVGSLKVAAAAVSLGRLNRDIEVETHCLMLSSNNADLIADYDIVVDCTDNFAVRYVINDACLALGKPFVYGSVYRFEGQVSLFRPGAVSLEGLPFPCYRCLYKEVSAVIPNCREAGVLGAVVGVIGSLQAVEVLKYLLGAGQSLCGRLLLFDALAMSFLTLKYAAAPDCVCGGRMSVPPTRSLRHCTDGVTVGDWEVMALDGRQLQARLNSADAPHLLDVRTLQEHRAMRFANSIHIPLDELEERFAELEEKISVPCRPESSLAAKQQEIVVYCRSGMRSGRAADLLRAYGYERVLNLSGGILGFCRDCGEEGLESDLTG